MWRIILIVALVGGLIAFISSGGSFSSFFSGFFSSGWGCLKFFIGIIFIVLIIALILSLL